jgi:hypothetical protein
MPEKRLRGRYELKKTAFLKEKAERRDDPRHVFYEAMVSSDNYDEYYRKVGNLKVHPPTFKNGPISAHMEIRYARWKGWIADR